MLYSMPVFVLYFVLLEIRWSSAQCTGANRTAFLRADNRAVQAFNGVTVAGIDLRRCFELCSNNVDDKGKGIQCASFQFDSSSSCILSNINTQPFGSGVLSQTSRPNTAIYQKICVATTQVCDKPFAFDWIPQSVLLGFAPQVQRFPTVSECLKACLESAAGAPCRSAMFFYESQQCILNAESRITRPDLFSNDTQGLIADYFDNACFAGDGGGVGVGPETGPTLEPAPFQPPPPNQVGLPAPSGYTVTNSPSANYAIPPPPPGYSYQEKPHSYQPGPTLPIYCDNSRSTQFLSTENMGVQEGLEQKLENVNAEMCQKLCENNKNEKNELIGCQAFSLDPTLHNCMLTSGLSMPRGSLHLIERNGVNFYEKICLLHAQSCNGKFPFTRIPAHVLVGFAGEVRRVPALAECLDACLYARTEIGYDCRSAMYYYSTTECIMNTETRFTRPDLFSGDTQGLFVDYFDNNCLAAASTISPPYYIVTQPQPVPPTYAQPQPPSPQGPVYPPDTVPNAVQPPAASYEITVPTYSANQWSPPGVLYTTASLGLSAARPHEPSASGGEEGVKSPSQEPLRPSPSSSGASNPHLDNVAFFAECREDEIRVNAIFKSPASGVLFVKNKHQSCREEFRSTDNAQLKIPLSETEKDCGQKPTTPDHYSFTVVLQQNGLGVTGLMTNDDVMYDVSCDLSSSRRPLVNAVTGASESHSTPIVVESNLGAIPPAPRENVGGEKNPIPEAQVAMDLLRDGVPVSNVLLGEQLEIRWRIAAPSNIGFFVRDCAAERVGGNPPDPAPLQLITEGCPDTAVSGRIISSPVTKALDGLATNMTVFRFDGSRSVRLRCLIDMCAGECTSTKCLIKSREWQSFGRRRKKRATLERPKSDRLSNFTSLTSVGKKTISGIFTIVDELPSIGKKGDRPPTIGSVTASKTGDTTTKYSINRDASPPPSTGYNELEPGEARSFMLYNGQLCLLRPLFVGLMTTLAILCTAEGLVVGACCWSKYCSSDRFCSSDSDSFSGVDPRLPEKLVSAVRRSSFFATAFGNVNSSFSNSSTVAAAKRNVNENSALRRKRNRRRRDGQFSGNSTTTTTTTGSSGEDQKINDSNEAAKNRRRPVLPTTAPTTLTAPKLKQEKSLPNLAADSRRCEIEFQKQHSSPSNKKQYATRPRFCIPPANVHPLSPKTSSDWTLKNVQTPLPTLRNGRDGERRLGAGSLSGASTIDYPMTTRSITPSKVDAAYKTASSKRRPVDENGLSTSDFF